MAAVFDNAIAWAQFQLTGGWRTTLITTGVYLTLIGGAVMLSTRLSVGTSTLSGWTVALLGLQSAILVIFASARIGMAIRSDVAARMVESHRLMPMPAWQAILGYMLGGASQPLALACVTFALGCATASASGAGVERFVVANAILFTFSAFVWSVMAFMSFAARPGSKRGGMGWVMGFIFLSASGNGGIVAVLPALSVLIAPMAGRSIYSMKATGDDLGFAYTISVAMQAVIGGLYFIAATRRYRRDDLPGFTPGMALLLLAAFAAATTVGMIWWDEFRPAILRMSKLDTLRMLPVQIIASSILAMLIGILPAASAARFESDWRRRRDIDDPALGPRPLFPVLVALLTGLVCLAPVFAAPRPNQLPETWPIPEQALPLRVSAALVCGVAFASFAMFISYVLRIIRRRSNFSPGWLVVIALVATWLVPLGLDVMRFVASQEEASLTAVSGCSPIGTLLALWGPYSFDVRPGLIFQIGLAGLLAAVFYLTQARKRRPSSA
ncbi:MAG: hypothetical protein ACREJC_21590 [Tepidisphaeraceae bacterium]